MKSHQDLPRTVVILACVIMILFTGSTSSADRVQEPAASGSDYNDEFEDFDGFVMDLLATYEVPGAYVGIVSDDKVIMSEGYGVLGVGRTEPVDENTRFQLASMSKFITATHLGTLISEGRVDWDTPLQEYLPGFEMMDPYAGEHATLRDMLEHRSGLRPYDCCLLGRLNLTDAEILERVRYMEPGSSFRDRYQYSNVGFFIAGEVAAAADNTSWEDSLEDRILVPLGMTRSGGDYSTLFLDENHAWGSMQDGNSLVKMDAESEGLNGAGGVVSTGADITHWISMVLNEGRFQGEEILSADVMHEITASNPALGKGGQGGGPLHDPNSLVMMGCDSYYFGEYRVFEKNGALDGVRTIVTFVPEKNIAIVVLANKHLTVFPEAVRAEFLERICGRRDTDLQAEVLKAQAAWYALGTVPEPPASRAPVSFRAEEITGRYKSRLYGDLSISSGAGEGEFRLSLGSVSYPGILRHWDGDTWQAVWKDPDDSPDLFLFDTDKDGRISGFKGDMMGEFQKVQSG